MRTGILNMAEDMQWLRDTHLRGVPLPEKYAQFKCAILHGNEDAPHVLDLYVSAEPNREDDYLHIKVLNNPPIYCDYIEYDGRIDKPKRTLIERVEASRCEFKEEVEGQIVRAFAQRYSRVGNVTTVTPDYVRIGQYQIVNLQHSYRLRVWETDGAFEEIGSFSTFGGALVEIAAFDAREAASDWLADLAYNRDSQPAARL